MRNTIELKGHVDVKTVPLLWRQHRDTLLAHKDYQVSLSQVNRIDSAGVGFLLALLERAQQVQSTLTLIDVPAQMQALATVQGVWPLFEKNSEK